jgi:hypothetical protein
MLGWARCRSHKKHKDTSHRTCVFVSGAICGPRNAFWCSRGVKCCSNVFSSSGGTGAETTKSAIGHFLLNLCFCIWWYLWVTYCILVRPGRETLTHYFSSSAGPGADPTKTKQGHFMSNLCFCIRWDLCITYYVLVCPRCKTSMQYFTFPCGLVRVQQEVCRDMLRRACVFATGVICGSHSALCCVWGAKHRCTIFNARVGLVQIPQKARWDKFH